MSGSAELWTDGGPGEESRVATADGGFVVVPLTAAGMVAGLFVALIPSRPTGAVSPEHEEVRVAR